MSNTRPYSHTDARALTIASRMCKVYEEFLPDFEAYDPDLGPAFRDAWLQAIEDALTMPTDETTVDDQQISAAVTGEQMAACAAAVRDLRYYASLAFTAKDDLRVFGFERLVKFRYAPAHYAVAVRTMHLLALDHASELTAKGMTPAHTQALLDTANALTDAEVQHEYKKRVRTRLTAQRKRAFLHMWSFVQRIQLAADVLFAEDEVKRGVFVGG
jgi:hypothetical protein